jgi:hypothetical protein
MIGRAPSSELRERRTKWNQTRGARERYELAFVRDEGYTQSEEGNAEEETKRKRKIERLNRESFAVNRSHADRLNHDSLMTQHARWMLRNIERSRGGTNEAI